MYRELQFALRRPPRNEFRVCYVKFVQRALPITRFSAVGPCQAKDSIPSQTGKLLQPQLTTHASRITLCLHQPYPTAQPKISPASVLKRATNPTYTQVFFPPMTLRVMRMD